MEVEELLGKTVLVGITDYDPAGNPVSQTQFFGRVEKVNGEGFWVRKQDGSDFWLPPDLSSTQPAPPGVYRLRSTGEVIENPDFLSVWNRTRE